jgi:hypothetical protein
MSTVQVIALKPFVYSTDGYTEIPVAEKEAFDLPEKFFNGLNDARYVRRAVIGDGKVSLKPSNEEITEKVKPIVETAVKLQEVLTKVAETKVDASDVEIPDDWRSLKFFALRSLAAKFGETPKNMEEAVAAIEAELAKRD